MSAKMIKLNIGISLEGIAERNLVGEGGRICVGREIFIIQIDKVFGTIMPQATRAQMRKVDTIVKYLTSFDDQENVLLPADAFGEIKNAFKQAQLPNVPHMRLIYQRMEDKINAAVEIEIEEKKSGA